MYTVLLMIKNLGKKVNNIQYVTDRHRLQKQFQDELENASDAHPRFLFYRTRKITVQSS